FFNSDGSEAEMCGNGSRCAVRFARELGMVKDRASIETLAGVVEAVITGNRVKVRLTPPADFRQGIRAELPGRTAVLDFLNTGVPHAVEFVPDVERAAVREDGRRIRFHPVFAPAGANANFCQVTG